MTVTTIRSANAAALHVPECTEHPDELIRPGSRFHRCPGAGGHLVHKGTCEPARRQRP